jgi:oligosaccharide repeat unit polymerase
MFALTIAAIVAVVAVRVALHEIKACGGITPFSAFLIASVAFVVIGFTVTYLENSDPAQDAFPVLNVSIGTAATIAGGTLAAANRRKRSRKTLATEIVNLDPGRTILGAWVLLCIVLAPFVYAGGMPLISGVLQLLSSGPSSNMLSQLRNANNPYLNPSASQLPLLGLFDELRYVGLELFAVFAFRFWQLRIKPKLSAAVVLTSAFLLLANGQRWPLFYLVVTLTIYNSWNHREAKHASRKPRTVVVVILAVCLAVIMSTLLGRNITGDVSIAEGLQSGFNDLWERLLVGNVDVPFAAYSMFPSPIGFLHGASYVLNAWSYVPGHPLPSFPVVFSQLVTGDPRNFTAPPDFFTEAYVNFGLIGTVLVSAAWGFTLSKMTDRMIRCSTLFGNGTWAVATTLAAFSSVGTLTWFVGLLIDLSVVWGILFVVRAPRKISQQDISRLALVAPQ